MINSPAPQPASKPAGLPTWAIVLIIVVVFCCLCVGATGLIFAFLDPIRQELGIAAVINFPILG